MANTSEWDNRTSDPVEGSKTLPINVNGDEPTQTKLEDGSVRLDWPNGFNATIPPDCAAPSEIKLEIPAGVMEKARAAYVKVAPTEAIQEVLDDAHAKAPPSREPEGDDKLRTDLLEIFAVINGGTHEHQTLLERLTAAAICDVTTLVEKDKSYGSSWKKRGGVGAFMMLARKWDRIETIMQRSHSVPGIGSAGAYEIFEQCEFNFGGVLDDVRDLRRYLLLVESELLLRGTVKLDA